ncbi:hypothetical protein [Dyella sp.]|jgi:hypothetical protein|uniref:hypothetical protein n=1 Tax=Dyella sp. TaxID=1869338 RepID=UPI002D77B8A4|nr:hypothetical protein [Dyella sp.]HET6432008.1 hypothetical protein [Dyella sp.]
MSPRLVDTLALAVLVPVLVVLWLPRLRRRDSWRATVTPLASIIGSGFLVVGPILADVAGQAAAVAMFGLCALAWLFGSAIRFNILHAEPLASSHRRVGLLRLDRAAGACLALAYFISVAYYLNLLGAFLLRGVGRVDPTLARAITTAILFGLAALGWRRGFRGVERLEIPAVSFKLAVIAGVLAALAGVWPAAPATHPLPPHGARPGWHELRVLLGCVILVQGFETSRFLGASYPAALRVRSMRWAQLLSTVIYVAFIVLLLPHVPPGHGVGMEETEIIDIVGRLSMSLGPLLVLAAIASQLSAAVADLGGAGGLLAELSPQMTPPRAYLAVAVVATALTWSANVFGIIAIASRAFAVYYALQCVLAAALARDLPLRRAAYAAGAALAVMVVLFGLPAG